MIIVFGTWFLDFLYGTISQLIWVPLVLFLILVFELINLFYVLLCIMGSACLRLITWNFTCHFQFLVANIVIVNVNLHLIIQYNIIPCLKRRNFGVLLLEFDRYWRIFDWFLILLGVGWAIKIEFDKVFICLLVDVMESAVIVVASHLCILALIFHQLCLARSCF